MENNVPKLMILPFNSHYVQYLATCHFEQKIYIRMSCRILVNVWYVNDIFLTFWFCWLFIWTINILTSDLLLKLKNNDFSFLDVKVNWEKIHLPILFPENLPLVIYLIILRALYVHHTSKFSQNIIISMFLNLYLLQKAS